MSIDQFITPPKKNSPIGKPAKNPAQEQEKTSYTPRSKNWVFTINNPTEQLPLWHDMYFRCYQKEKGNKEGTEHFQGMVMFTKRLTLSQLKKIDPRAHWEMMRGTPEQALTYCTKQDTKIDGPWYDGAPKEDAIKQKPGKRSDLEDCLATFKDQGKQAAIDQHAATMIRYHSGIEYCAKGLDSPYERPKPFNAIFWGGHNTGKTYAAQNNYGTYYEVPRSSNSIPWLNGYTNQNTLIIDEFGKGIYSLTAMNKYLDKVCPEINVKNGYGYGKWNNVIILSNDDPSTWYRGEGVSEEQRDAFFSRFHLVKEFKTERKDSWRGKDKTVYCFEENGKTVGYDNKAILKEKMPSFLLSNDDSDPCHMSQVSKGNTSPYSPTCDIFEKNSVKSDFIKADEESSTTECHNQKTRINRELEKMFVGEIDLDQEDSWV